MKVGIAGGGQLGRMLAEAAHELGHPVVVLDVTPNSPAGQVADEQIVADYKDAEAIRTLAASCDVLTYEIESVNAEALRALADAGFPVHPTPHTLALIKDKLRQKEFLAARGIPTAPFCAPESAEQLGYPYIFKARSGGFDGRGNALVEKKEDLAVALERLGGVAMYAEGFVRFEKELAIVAARTTGGQTSVYPLVETVHKDHICHEVIAPAPVDAEVARKAHDLAQKVLASFDGAGVFAIEMFLVSSETTLSEHSRVEGSAHSTGSGRSVAYQLIVNEIAPRVHNSGHFSIEGCVTSQFEQHIRAITGMPLGSPDMKVPAAVMINILGDRTGPAEPKGVEEAEALGGIYVHIYGKAETKPQRKMGHITATAGTLEDAKTKAEHARRLVTI